MNKQLFLKSNAQKYISFVDNEKKKKEAELLVENIQELVEIETQKLSELLNLLENNLHPKNLEVEFIKTISEPLQEFIPESIKEPKQEEILEPIKESNQEQILEPIKESNQEQILEPIQEPIQEPILEPIQEPIQEPIIEPKNDIVKNTILDIMNEVINEEKNSAETLLVSSNKIDEDVKIQKSENIKNKKNKNKKYI
jgi:hypothetical protein